MNSAIIIHDDSITFSLQRGNPEGHQVFQLSMDALYTPYGFFVSPTRAGNEPIDLIAGKAIEGKCITLEGASLLVTTDGTLYRFIRFRTTYAKQLVQRGVGTYCIFSDQDDVVQALSMAMHLHKGDVNKAIELVSKDIMIRPKTYVTYKIADIVKELKKRGAKEPLFLERFGPALPEEKKT